MGPARACCQTPKSRMLPGVTERRHHPRGLEKPAKHGGAPGGHRGLRKPYPAEPGSRAPGLQVLTSPWCPAGRLLAPRSRGVGTSAPPRLVLPSGPRKPGGFTVTLA